MKINSMTVTTKQNTRAVTFGFWQPGMSSPSKFASQCSNQRIITNPLNGDKVHKYFRVLSNFIEKVKTRHVNIKGTQLKRQRTTFNEDMGFDAVYKYRQDKMPSGTLISEKINSINKSKEKIVENKRGNWWHSKTVGDSTTVDIYKANGSKATYKKTTGKGKYTKTL